MTQTTGLTMVLDCTVPHPGDDSGTVVGLVQLLPVVSVGSAVPGTWENARLSGPDKNSIPASRMGSQRIRYRFLEKEKEDGGVPKT